MTVMSILRTPLNDVPLCALDLETSGISKESAEIVEISIWRKNPKEPWRCILDTLVRPRGSVGATHIHGITPEAVSEAPFFFFPRFLYPRTLSRLPFSGS
jgi:DNA polymerase-3 subunit epsilon